MLKMDVYDGSDEYMNYVVIFAGGVGMRMGSSVPKQFLEVDHKPILIHTIEKFSRHNSINGIVVVCKQEYIGFCEECLNKFKIDKILHVVSGGENGQDSIFKGLDYLIKNISDSKDDIVLIHDGVRPAITDLLITKSIDCAKKNGNSIAVSKAIETVIKIDGDGNIEETLNRTVCRNAKAPQCFNLSEIWKTHLKARRNGYNEMMVDSASLMSSYGYTLHTIECGPENIKITTPNDFYMFKAIYEASKERGITLE